mgnify:CR=1 FL=1
MWLKVYDDLDLERKDEKEGKTSKGMINSVNERKNVICVILENT